jgi:predicted nucleic acid-binding protein
VIVADTNVIAALYLQGPGSAQAERLLQAHARWAVPPLWRSELRSVLDQMRRHRGLALDTAQAIMAHAESRFGLSEQDIPSAGVLDLAAASGCTPYDCEFVAVARLLDIPLATWDRALQRAFPRIALAPERLVA